MLKKVETKQTEIVRGSLHAPSRELFLVELTL